MSELIPVAALVPCYNEADSIAGVVTAIARYLRQVVVVDDGSTDATAAVAEAAGATVIRHAKNRGKGAALRTGLEHLLKTGYTWAVTMDGDGQHSADDLPAFLERARNSDARLVVGDRMAQAREMSWLRRHVNHWMSRQLSRRAGRFLPDTQSGYRLIHLPTWEKLSLAAQRFEVESEMLMAFVTAGYGVEFLPVRVVASQRPSRIRPVADTVRWLRWWLASWRVCRARREYGKGLLTPGRRAGT